MLGVGEGKPWGEAIRSALIAEPDRWFSAVELVDQYAHLIPPEDIRRRAEQRKRHGSSSAGRSAASTIIGGVIYTAISWDHFERRRGLDGRLEVRASRTLGEIWTARRPRMLADAGLMTLAETAAVIGVSYGQVLSYVHRGLLPGTKFGNIWTVPAEDVHGFKPPPTFADSLVKIMADAGLMTPAAAAAAIGVTPATVCNYIRQGLLPGTKFANRWGVSAEDVRNFKQPWRWWGDPRLKALLADDGLMTAVEAGAVIGVTRQSVPHYVRLGLLPGTKLASGLWVVPAGYVYGFKRPRKGRPLSPQGAWDRILGGRVDLDNPHLYSYRGTVSRWSGEAAVVAALLKRRGAVVGGAHAAVVHGARLDPLADAAHVYVAEASMDGGLSDAGPMRGLVADPLGEVVVRAVAADAWERLRGCARPAEGVRRRPVDSPSVLYAPAATAALDLLLSPYPDERQAAAAVLGAAQPCPSPPPLTGVESDAAPTAGRAPALDAEVAHAG